LKIKKPHHVKKKYGHSARSHASSRATSAAARARAKQAQNENAQARSDTLRQQAQLAAGVKQIDRSRQTARLTRS
jgi:hypothetical protein